MIIKRSLLYFSILSIFCFFLKGCHPYSPKELTEQVTCPVELEETVDHALATTDFINGNWPSANWWEMFSDDALGRLIDKAIENNPSIEVAAAHFESAKQVAYGKRSTLFPQLYNRFENNYRHISKDDLDRLPGSQVPAVVNQAHLHLNFNWEIDIWGKYLDRYRSAIGLARSAEANEAYVKLIVTTSLAQAYFEYQRNLSRIALLENTVADAKSYLDLQEKRKQFALDNQLVVELAKRELYKYEKMLIEARKDAQLDRYMINILMGLGPDSEAMEIQPNASFDRPFPLPLNIPVDLLARRPDLMMEIWQMEAAAYEIKAARKEFYPNINLLAFAGLETLSYGTLFNLHSFSGSLSPAYNLPIFTGGKLTAQLKEKIALFEMSAHQFRKQLLEASKEVTDQVATLFAVSSRLNIEKQKVDSIETTYDLEVLRYKFALVDYLTVLSTHENVLNEKLSEIDLIFGKQLAALNLIKALGGGYVYNYED